MMRISMFLGIYAVFSPVLLAQTTQPAPLSSPSIGAQANQTADNTLDGVKTAVDGVRPTGNSNMPGVPGSSSQGLTGSASNQNPNQNRANQNYNATPGTGMGNVQGRIDPRTQTYGDGRAIPSTGTTSNYDNRQQYQPSNWQNPQNPQQQNSAITQTNYKPQFEDGVSSYASGNPSRDRSYVLQHDATGREFICVNGQRVYFDQQATSNRGPQIGAQEQNNSSIGSGNHIPQAPNNAADRSANTATPLNPNDRSTQNLGNDLNSGSSQEARATDAPAALNPPTPQNN